MNIWNQTAGLRAIFYAVTPTEAVKEVKKFRKIRP